jgi:hypothetical protein
MAVAHRDRLAGDLEFHRTAEAAAVVGLAHHSPHWGCEKNYRVEMGQRTAIV